MSSARRQPVCLGLNALTRGSFFIAVECTVKLSKRILLIHELWISCEIVPMDAFRSDNPQVNEQVTPCGYIDLCYFWLV